MDNHKKSRWDELFDLILSLKDRQECYDLFNDLCTIKELNSMAERLHAAKLLKKGMTYEQIIAETDISSATLSRVSKCVQYGEGYKNLLD